MANWTQHLHFLQSDTQLALLVRASFSAELKPQGFASAAKSDLVHHFWLTFYGEVMVKADALRDVLAEKGLLNGEVCKALTELQVELGNVYLRTVNREIRTTHTDPLRAAVLEATL